MPQEQEKKHHEEKPASTEDVERDTEKSEDDLFNFDDLLGSHVKRLKKWRQVGQTGGQ